MKFKLTREESQTSITLYLHGELDLSTASELRAAINHEIERTDKELLVNFKGLDYIDSTGLGVVLSMLKSRKALAAPVRLVELPAKIQRLFDITGVSKFLVQS